MVADPIATSEDLGLDCTATLAPGDFHEVGVRMAMDGFKWDLQVGDVPALAPFALTLPKRSWDLLARLASDLTKELMAVEAELSSRPEFWGELGLPPKVRRVLESELAWTPAAARIVRYDFHLCCDGLTISEVNSDVPGGLNESSALVRLMNEFWPHLHPAGDPMAALAVALAAAAGSNTTIALIAAPGYTEDLQVISGVAAALRQRGMTPIRTRPEQIRWTDGRAEIDLGTKRMPVGAIYRFFQGEWTQRLAGNAWGPLFKGGLTPVCNPGVSVLTESKRLPLVWSKLDSSSPTWSELLPISSRPQIPALGCGRDWVFKQAYCNTGDSVICRDWSLPGALRRARLGAAFRPRSWVAQRRFDPLWLNTPLGRMNPCLGVYTVDGRAVGIYGRMSPQSVIDYSARDVAVLIQD